MKFAQKWLALLLSLALTLTAVPGQVQIVKAEDTSSAYIIVQFENNYQVIRKVTFSSDTTLLEGTSLAGFDVKTTDSAWGPFVCEINGYSCTSDDYWVFYKWDVSAWEYATNGASATYLADGDIYGWTFQTTSSTQALPPANAMVAGYNALEWLQDQQSTEDGGYGSVQDSTEAAMAVSANGIAASDWSLSSGPSLLSYLNFTGAAYSQKSASAASKLMVSLNASGDCYPAGSVLPSAYYDSSTGKYGDDGAGALAWAILGSAAHGDQISDESINSLEQMVDTSGGWAWDSSSAATSDPDTNTTALAVQALIAADIDPNESIITNAVTYLHTAQQADGGFVYAPSSSTTSDVDSTGYVFQALLAAGETPTDPSWISSDGKTPLSYLLDIQLSDGSFPYQESGTSNAIATRQVIPALLYRSFPLSSTSLSSCSLEYIPSVIR